MKHTITARITIPRNIAKEEAGIIYLYRQIDNIAQDLQEQHGHSSVEYMDHVLDAGGSDRECLSYVVTFKVV